MTCRGWSTIHMSSRGPHRLAQTAMRAISRHIQDTHIKTHAQMLTHSLTHSNTPVFITSWGPLTPPPPPSSTLSEGSWFELQNSWYNFNILNSSLSYILYIYIYINELTNYLEHPKLPQKFETEFSLSWRRHVSWLVIHFSIRMHHHLEPFV